MRASVHLFEQGLGWDNLPDPQYDSEQTLLLVFGPAHLPAALEAALGDLLTLFPRSVVMGCSSAGEIYQDRLVDGSLGVAILRFERTRLRLEWVRIESPEVTENAGRRLAERLLADDLSGVFVLADGLTVNGSALVNGIASVLDDTVVTGGMSADGGEFIETWLMCQGVRKVNVAVACGFYGEYIQIDHASRGGWDMLGIDRRVTRAEGNILYELDGQPALSLYKRYLGELSKDLPSAGLRFPMAILNTGADEVIRAILSVNEQDRSIILAGGIATGDVVRLMQANYERLIDGASQAASDLAASFPVENCLCVSISCYGRRWVLGERTDEEIESVHEFISDGIQQIGFYSYGEISPLASGRCDLHNQTMTLTLFSETEA